MSTTRDVLTRLDESDARSARSRLHDLLAALATSQGVAFHARAPGWSPRSASTEVVTARLRTTRSPALTARDLTLTHVSASLRTTAGAQPGPQA